VVSYLISGVEGYSSWTKEAGWEGKKENESAPHTKCCQYAVIVQSSKVIELL
jgi:hypothetical protein